MCIGLEWTLEYSIMPVGLISGIPQLFQLLRLLLRIASLGLQASTGHVQGMMSCDPCSPWVQLVATTIFGQRVEWKLHAIFHSGSESSTLFSLSGAKVPGNESSTHGTFAPGSKSTWEWKFQLPELEIRLGLGIGLDLAYSISWLEC